MIVIFTSRTPDARRAAMTRSKSPSTSSPLKRAAAIPMRNVEPSTAEDCGAARLMEGLFARPKPPCATRNSGLRTGCKVSRASNRNLLDDLEPVPVEPHDFPRAVGEQSNLAETERHQNLGANTIVSEVHRRRWLARFRLQRPDESLSRILRLH